MLWVIVAVVVVGAMFVLGALVGGSIVRTRAGDRARRAERDRRIAALRNHALVTGALVVDGGYAAGR